MFDPFEQASTSAESSVVKLTSPKRLEFSTVPAIVNAGLLKVKSPAAASKRNPFLMAAGMAASFKPKRPSRPFPGLLVHESLPRRGSKWVHGNGFR
jgi:hypothetical protein